MAPAGPTLRTLGTVAIVFSFLSPLLFAVDAQQLAVCNNHEPYSWASEMCMVDAELKRSPACQPCLVGERWDELRQVIGTKYVQGRRKISPSIAISDWAAHILQSSIFRILAEEMLGYDVKTHIADFTRTTDELLDEECTAVNLEIWTLGDQMEREKEALEAKKIVKGLNGAVGRERLYVPAFMDATAAHWENMASNVRVVRGLGEAVATMDLFSSDGFVGPENLTSWYNAPEYGCSAESRASLNWEESTCIQGRWYPPQCGHSYPSPDCKELYMAEMVWSSGDLFRLKIHICI
mmetsp:Transcript_36845/g.103958  ORF Transcript_36845/g.103958 Transcript_36845/m.103958 type:complete len:294 (+) Transcript_36845:371-1252(+)